MLVAGTVERKTQQDNTRMTTTVAWAGEEEMS